MQLCMMIYLKKYQHDITDFDYDLLHINEKNSTANIQESIHSDDIEELGESMAIDVTGNLNKISDIDDSLDNNLRLTDDENFDLKAHLSHLEQSLIQEALTKSKGVVAHAAKHLNIRRTTLVEKMKKYKIN